MVKILGLDISSVSTGYCIINNGKLDKNILGTINPDKKYSHGGKLQYFAEELTKLLRKHKPDKIIIEDIYKGPNIVTFKTLAMFRGVCLFIVFKELGKNPVSIMPTKARSLIGVKGKTKEIAFDFVVKKYSFSNYNLDAHGDITDAIVLGLSGEEMEKQGLSEKDLRKKKKRRRKKKSKK